MIIPFNYLVIINSIGELMQDSHCATLVFSTALDFLSMFFSDKSESLCFLKELFNVNSALLLLCPMFLH